jgi:hypothetical protein
MLARANRSPADHGHAACAVGCLSILGPSRGFGFGISEQLADLFKGNAVRPCFDGALGFNSFDFEI